MNQLVSVVIPTRNSASTLERCLLSLKRQTYPNVEVIVVDRFSTDETQRIAERCGAKVISGGEERSQQTNIGAREARGEYLYRTDGDFVFDPTLISSAVEKMQSGFDAVIVHGTSDETVSLWARVRKGERECLEGDWAHTAACIFRRGVFLSVGGFDERLSAFEDYDLNNRLQRKGYRIGRIGARAIHLGEPKVLGDVVKKYRYYGNRSNITEFASKNPSKGLWQISPIRLVYLRNIRKFGLYFFPFLLYYYVKYASAVIGFLFS